MTNRLTIKNIDLSTPFFFAPINTGLAVGGNPTRDLISFHKKKSNTYTSLNYVGNIAICEDYTTNKNTLFINDKMEGYAKLANSILKKGSLPAAQIAAFKSSFIPQHKWRNKNIEHYKEHVINEILTYKYHDIKKIIDNFSNGITKLHSLGYQAIQIHAAHGYLLNSFISETFNHRNDSFGKDKLLIIKEILSKIENIKNSLIVDIRISLYEENFRDFLSASQLELINSLYEIPEIDMISISNGIYNIDKSLIYPPKKLGINFLVPSLTKHLSKLDKKVWNISGNIRDFEKLPLNYKNLTYSIGRPILADNDYLFKYFNDKTNINHCTFCNKCHYYSRKKDFIECGVNQILF